MAVRVHVYHVIPPNVSSLCLIVVLVIQAFLSQVFIDDLFPFHLVLRVSLLNCAILALSVAVLVQERLLAVLAFPEHVMGRHQYRLAKVGIRRRKVSDKVECLIIGGGHPEVVFNPVVRLL